MKKSIALFALLIASSAFGQVIAYREAGKITSSSFSDFKVGRSYTFDFSINFSMPPGSVFEDLMANYGYGSACVALKFNYDKGAYIGTADSAFVWTLNYPTGDAFTIGTPLGNINFPDVEGQPIFKFALKPILDLHDASGLVLSSPLLADLPQITRFVGGSDDRFFLNWGDFQKGVTGSLEGSVDSIKRVDSSPLSPVPEPSTYGLVASLALTGMIARKIKTVSRAAG